MINKFHTHRENAFMSLTTLTGPVLAPVIKYIQDIVYGEIMILDESSNPTGTHKDRMAKSIADTYQSMLTHNSQLRISMISSGSAAYSIQRALAARGLPALKVLIDESREEKDILALAGCEVFSWNLESKSLSSNDILAITDNLNGIEITSNMAIRPYESYYQEFVTYLSDFDAGYIFTPYGTGHLYGSFLSCEVFKHPSKVNIIGGKTHNRASKADKLYAPFNPFNAIDDNFIKTKIALGKIGPNSAIIEFKEPVLYEAMTLAAQHGLQLEPSALGGFAVMLSMLKQGTLHPYDKKLVIVTGKSQVYKTLAKKSTTA
jgi:hypothetical protein